MVLFGRPSDRNCSKVKPANQQNPSLYGSRKRCKSVPYVPACTHFRTRNILGFCTRLQLRGIFYLGELVRVTPTSVTQIQIPPDADSSLESLRSPQ